MTKNYEEYKQEVSEGISTCLQEMGCQPILFVGSGISRRYFGAATWEELLIKMSKNCPLIDKEFAYYKQSTKSLAEIGSIFADQFREWVWGKGKSEFSAELFDASMHRDIYLKSKVSDYFNEITPRTIADVKGTKEQEELSLLQQIRPHAIITTNYDSFLEAVFPDYQPIVGQKILRQNYVSVGEIFKIHGCAKQPDSLVLTTNDYDNFKDRKKYLSAKLFTYFAEHPLLFMGYSAEDDNIKSILADIDELLSATNELIPNIYILDWKRDILGRVENRIHFIIKDCINGKVLGDGLRCDTYSRTNSGR